MAAGCLPSTESALDEQKEPHFLAGKSRVASLDYKGAIDEFEKAVEINPRSASAHLELGLLYESADKNEPDYAAAIYHMNRYLQLRPSAENGSIVKQRIISCKQELAKSVSLAPVTQSMQNDLGKLITENRELKQKLEAWQNYYASRGESPTNTIRTQSVVPQAQPQVQQPQTPTARPVQPATSKTYTIKQGDSPYLIAKKNGISLNSLMAANPGLDAKRLRPGQTINLP